MARTRAANPAAEEARPAAVGKLFSETTWSLKVLSFGRVGSEASSSARRDRSSRKHAVWRGPEMSCGSPFRWSVSEENEAEHAAVVCVRRSFWERVTEREEFVGRLRAVSRLPQYLNAGWGG